MVGLLKIRYLGSSLILLSGIYPPATKLLSHEYLIDLEPLALNSSSTSHKSLKWAGRQV